MERRLCHRRDDCRSLVTVATRVARSVEPDRGPTVISYRDFQNTAFVVRFRLGDVNR
jgi:hypothetical protein